MRYLKFIVPIIIGFVIGEQVGEIRMHHRVDVTVKNTLKSEVPKIDQQLRDEVQAWLTDPADKRTYDEMATMIDRKLRATDN